MDLLRGRGVQIESRRGIKPQRHRAADDHGSIESRAAPAVSSVDIARHIEEAV